MMLKRSAFGESGLVSVYMATSLQSMDLDKSPAALASFRERTIILGV
jgi:hypothetical protein